VDNQQHGAGPGLDPGCAERMPALFLRFAVDAVLIHKASLVLKDQSRQLKRDSAVFRWLPRFFSSFHS
jgi:hypothetical protein